MSEPRTAEYPVYECPVCHRALIHAPKCPMNGMMRLRSEDIIQDVLDMGAWFTEWMRGLNDQPRIEGTIEPEP